MDWISDNPDEVVHPIEIMPGSYKKNRPYSEESIYLPEERFAHFEPLFILHDPMTNVSRYSFAEVLSPLWKAVIEDLHAWVNQIDNGARLNDLSPQPGFAFRTSRSEFLDHEDENLRTLRNTAAKLAQWLEKKLQEQNVISVLGM